ncbi:MAG TPA: 3-isopropylmalate dehydratase large subunit [Propionibacteriaceae bacterium]|nr:3-isopropylmalate dehydratase large subunit [Propionibacteriaceae bacterium]
MRMTIAEKILAAHAGLDEVTPGELVDVEVDLVLANDITAPIAIKELERVGLDKVFDPERVVLVPDHFAPNMNIKAAEQCKIVRDFAHDQALTNYFEVGKGGIEHVILPEKGLVAPGELVVGADSHTCTYGALGAFSTGMGSTDIAAAMATGHTWLKVPETIKFVYTGELPRWVGGKDLILHTIGDIGVDGALYKAMEFSGPVIDRLPMDGRFTMANMAIEAGGKAGIFHVDEKTKEYVAGRIERPYTIYASDPDARYDAVYEYDVTDMEPVVSLPHLPSNAVPLSQARGIKMDQVVIGSCTNGRWDDMVTAAEVLRGQRVSDALRCIVIPGSQAIFRKLLAEGLMEVFIDAGAVVSTPTCGPCLGGYMGILAAGERCISTTNRNFVGRMGHRQSEVYLANPAVAAASAILGHIGGPADL